MFIVIAAIVIIVLGGFMSLSIKTTTSLAKIGQGVVMLALIVGAIVIYFVFSAPHGSTQQHQANSQKGLQTIEDMERQYLRPQSAPTQTASGIQPTSTPTALTKEQAKKDLEELEKNTLSDFL